MTNIKQALMCSIIALKKIEQFGKRNSINQSLLASLALKSINEYMDLEELGKELLEDMKNNM